ncbi:MAG: hypothetical protein LLF28_02645 [Nitrospiraceae bacterium]|nr:hypothetical protein [Nitrospiraceae bacterium]
MKNKSIKKAFLFVFLSSLALFLIGAAQKKEVKSRIVLSSQTQACITCHKLYTPGIVEDWLTSKHSKITPGEALKKPALQKRVSADSFAKEYLGVVVGCYECHSQNPDKHKDNFNHMGFIINVIVAPGDCNTCHPVEFKQFTGSKKSNGYKNIWNNPVYHKYINTITGLKKIENGKITVSEPTASTLQETCFGCHGAKIEVRGTKKINTQIGDIEVPDLANWPNQGIGRVNPDGTTGSCTACHPRHSFSIEIARKPYTCSQCHLEPDVPAYNVYKESKHGNIYSSKYQEWNFNSVPWVVGKDFTAPTCAACHNSLLVSPNGKIIAERSHDFGSRLWVRLFGLIYSAPQPKSGDTTIIKNKDGLPLPTTFLNEPASEYLLDKKEQAEKFKIMHSVCNSCHNKEWIDGHFAKLDNTIKETNEMTLAATKLMIEAWEEGIEDKTNPFDETIEQLWVKQWFFYSNAIRYASAMTGAPDYTAFKLGWWELTNNLRMMRDMIDFKKQLKKK